MAAFNVEPAAMVGTSNEQFTRQRQVNHLDHRVAA
jgi:hypothetical protein